MFNPRLRDPTYSIDVNYLKVKVMEEVAKKKKKTCIFAKR